MDHALRVDIRIGGIPQTQVPSVLAEYRLTIAVDVVEIVVVEIVGMEII
jgi:hypothetical protein